MVLWKDDRLYDITGTAEARSKGAASSTIGLLVTRLVALRFSANEPRGSEATEVAAVDVRRPKGPEVVEELVPRSLLKAVVDGELAASASSTPVLLLLSDR